MPILRHCHAMNQNSKTIDRIVLKLGSIRPLGAFEEFLGFVRIIGQSVIEGQSNMQ